MSTKDKDVHAELDSKVPDGQDEVAAPGHGEFLETKYASLGRIQVAKVFWKAMLCCAVLNWAALNDGFQQQIPGNVIPMEPFIKQMADTTINGVPAISAEVISYWQGFAEMSKMVGMGVGGIVADRFGRRGSMFIAIVILFGGSITEILAHDWKSWLGGAILIRFGVGLAQTVLVTYISEVAPFQIRGFMVGSYQLNLGVGQLISAIATKIMTTTNPDQWKPLIATEFLFTGILALMMPWVPESHLYHARRGNDAKAKRSMVRLYGTAPDYDVEYEYQVIKHGIEAERDFAAATKNVSFLEIFRGVNWRRTLAGCMGIMTQPFAGAPIVFGYSTYFFQVAGLQDPFMVTVITYILLIVSISCSLVLCERIGRRPLLIGGCVAMLLFNIGLASTGFFEGRPSDRAALGMLLLWVLAYGSSAGPIGFVAAGETSTPRLRAKTTAFNLGCYGAGFVVFQWTVPYMISPDAADLGVKAIFVWAGLLVPTIVLLYFFYPETYGRTYLELDELYERGIPAWRFATTETASDQSGRKNAGLMSSAHRADAGH